MGIHGVSMCNGGRGIFILCVFHTMKRFSLVALLLLSACAPSRKKKIIFDVTRDEYGMIEFKRNRKDIHDNFQGDVTICGYDKPTLWR